MTWYFGEKDNVPIQYDFEECEVYNSLCNLQQYLTRGNNIRFDDLRGENVCLLG